MSRLAPPLTVEIVVYAPTAFYHCPHCEVVWQHTGFSQGVRAEQVRSALPPELLAEYQRVSDWVRQLLAAYGSQVRINIIDVASLEGVWASLRYRLRHYPAVVVEGRHIAGTDFSAAEAEVARKLAARAAAEA